MKHSKDENENRLFAPESIHGSLDRRLSCVAFTGLGKPGSGFTEMAVTLGCKSPPGIVHPISMRHFVAAVGAGRRWLLQPTSISATAGLSACNGRARSTQRARLSGWIARPLAAWLATVSAAQSLTSSLKSDCQPQSLFAALERQATWASP